MPGCEAEPRLAGLGVPRVGDRGRGPALLGLDLATHLRALLGVHNLGVAPCHGSYGTKGGARCVSQLGAGRKGVSISWARAPSMKAALFLCNTLAGARRGRMAKRRGRRKSRPKPGSIGRTFFLRLRGCLLLGFFDLRPCGIVLLVSCLLYTSPSPRDRG